MIFRVSARRAQKQKRHPKVPFSMMRKKPCDYFLAPILVKAWKASVEALVICS